MKKYISLILTLAMLAILFCISGVSAADGDVVKTVDFSDYAPSVNTELPASFTEQGYTITKGGTDRKVYYLASDGEFGKQAGDKALDVQQVFHTGSNPQTQWYQLRYNANMARTNQKYFYFSTEMAIPQTQVTRWLGVQFNKTGGTDGKSWAAVNQIVRMVPAVDNTAQVELSFLGQASSIAVPLQSWMKIDFTMDIVTGLADVYYNGKKVVENYQTGIGTDHGITVTSFAQAIWGIYQMQTNPAGGNTSYATNHTYIDNIYCAFLNEPATVNPYTPYEMVTFADYEGGNLPDGFALNAGADIVSAHKDAGKFGKDSDDVSLRVSTEKGSTSSAKWEQLRYTNPIPAWSFNHDLYHKVSFKMAYSGKYMNRWVNLAFTPWISGGTTDKWDVGSNVTNKFMINVVKNAETLEPELYVDGTLITSIDNSIIAQNKWMRFDIVANGSTANRVFDVYINGTQVAADVAMNVKSTNTWSRLVNVAQVQFGINHEWSVEENCFPVTDTYFDDILVTKHGTYPEIEAFVTDAPADYADVVYYAGNEVTENVLEATAVDVSINEDINVLPVLAVYSIDSAGSEALEKVVLGKKGDMDIHAEFEAGSKVTLFTLESISSLKPLHSAVTILNGVVGEMPTAAAFTVSGMFSDNAVIQRDKQVTIWGKSDSADGATLNVKFGDYYAIGTVNDGRWEATLPPMPVNTEGETLYVYSADNSVEFDNILVGDVYLVAGQSNAELPFSTSDTYATDRLEISADDNIRFFYQARNDAMNLSEDKQTTPQEDIINSNYKWEVAESYNTGKISSLGYYFADAIVDATDKNIPIGILQTAFGSARLAELSPKSVNDIYDQSVSADRVKYNAYNTLVSPTEKYAARGMLWYQGESDSKDDTLASTYVQRFDSLMEYIRNIQGSDFPVFFVQLSSHTDHEDKYSGYTYQWLVPRFRNEQNKIEDTTEDTYITVSLDQGLKVGDTNDTAHPVYKKEIARRMADIAIKRIYNIGDISSVMSPKVKSIEYDDLGATISFERTNGGLMLMEGSGELAGFELLKDGIATAASAEIISENTVRVTGVDSPTGVRYAYHNAVSPAIANLLGGNGLPCPTFSDNGFDIAPSGLGQQR